MATPTDMDRLGSAWSAFKRLINNIAPATAGALQRARGRLPH